jgi:hypothetical protein
MSDYRCYFLDKRGELRDVRDIISTDDATAILIASGLLKGSKYRDFELWHGARLVISRQAEQRVQ